MGRKNDKITAAIAKAERANNIFAAAYAEVNQANDLLDQAIAEHEAEVASRLSRIELANSHKAKNTKVASKLAEFV